MHRRRQGPKDDTKNSSEPTPAITFALISIHPTDAKGANFWTQLATAALSTFEQQELWARAEWFFQRELRCMGRLIEVTGDLKPAASYLILAPRVRLLPDQLQIAKQFMTECASFKSFRVQLQLGRSAVVDHAGENWNGQLLSYCANCRGCAAVFVCSQFCEQALLP